jgi:cell division protein FtsI (penicillin-binding protein 3)
VPLIHRRIGLLFAAFLGLLAFAGLKATWLGTVKASSLKRAATTQQVEQIKVPARRGSIVDRRGIELAVSEPASDVAATPYLVKDAPRAARLLAPLLDADPDELLRKLARRDTGFVYLARQLPASRAAEISKLKLPGLQLIPTSRRTYPRGWLAAQVLGSVGIDGKGLSGLEYGRDSVLHGRDGTRRMTKDALQQPIAVQDTVPAEEGKSLRLTIDAAIQSRVETVLGDVGQRYRPKGATAIVMDPRDGRILALANWPRVDANDPGAAPDYARQNRAVGFNYEPGSTFKPFTVAGALQDDVVQPDTKFELGDTIQVADRTIHNNEDEPGGMFTTEQILAQSNNVGTVTIGLKLGKKRFARWVDEFGFGKPTGVDLPGEERGQVLPLAKYSGSSMGNLPIGQGISVTPMQMASEYAAIANGGTLRPPRVVGAVGGVPTPTPDGRRIMSKRTAADLRDMLRGVFLPGGTASEVSIPGYELAGKTGTANKVDRSTGLYSTSQYVASFVGFAPAGHPKLLCAVMVDEPQGGSIYGGVIAAPAFGQIMAFALPYLRIPPH